MKRRVLALAAVLGSALVACQLLIGIEDEGVNRPADAATFDDAAEVDPCVKLHPPSKPVDVPPNGESLDYSFAIRRFRVRPRGEPPLGFDLDDRCTGDLRSTTNDSPCRPTNEAKDDDGGVDNAFGRIVDLLSLGFDGGTDVTGDAISDNVANGLFTQLVLLYDYNGTANDDAVRVALVESQLITGGCTPDADGGKPTPKWDGCDTWGYLAGTPTFGNQLATADGWVTDDVLVVKLGTIQFGLGIASFKLQEAILKARLVHDGGAVRLSEGVVAGRADVTSLFATAAHLSLNDKTDLICNNAPTLDFVRKATCDAPDLPHAKADDGTDEACDAVSFAIGFEAERAKIGAERPRAPDQCDASALSCQ